MYVCIYTHKYNIHKHIFKGLLKACGSQASAFELNENVTGYIIEEKNIIPLYWIMYMNLWFYDIDLDDTLSHFKEYNASIMC